MGLLFALRRDVCEQQHSGGMADSVIVALGPTLNWVYTTAQRPGLTCAAWAAWGRASDAGDSHCACWRSDAAASKSPKAWTYNLHEREMLALPHREMRCPKLTVWHFARRSYPLGEYGCAAIAAEHAAKPAAWSPAAMWLAARLLYSAAMPLGRNVRDNAAASAYTLLASSYDPGQGTVRP